MRNLNSNRLAIAGVTGLALTAIVFSQLAFAQGRNDRNTSGVSDLIGRSRIRPGDARFQPAALMVINEATFGDASSMRGRWVFSETIASDYINRTIIRLPDRLGRAGRPGGDMRPLTPSEALLMEELFSTDLSNVRGIDVSGDGIEGNVSPRDLRIKSQDLMSKARARGAAK